MRKLILLACSLIAAVVAASAGAAEPNNGTLSVDQGRGVVMLDLRGSVLGRLGNGTLRVTDHTPRDRFGEIVFGRKVVEERVGPRTMLYRGQGLRFRMLGGGYRIVVRGSGIAVSAVGRGVVSLDGERRGDETTGHLLADGRRLLGRARALHAASRRARALRAREAGRGREPPSAVVNQQQHSILVVEDETSIASFVAAYLRNAGYEVRTASTAHAAVVELTKRGSVARRPRPEPPRR